MNFGPISQPMLCLLLAGFNCILHHRHIGAADYD